MDRSNVAREAAQEIEQCEIAAWSDLYDAAPPAFAQKYRLKYARQEDAVLFSAHGLPGLRFNRVMGLGLLEPAAEDALGRVLAFYRESAVRSFMVQHLTHALPVHITEWLERAGFTPAGGWERVYRGAAPLEPAADRQDYGIERVSPQNAEDWALYIDSVYGLRNRDWLLSLVERPGWHHYMLRGPAGIEAVRSMYVRGDGGAWLGIEAPIPGLMTPSCGPDSMLCRAMIEDGLRMGARFFAADVEDSSPYLDTPACSGLAALGFVRPYYISNWVTA